MLGVCGSDCAPPFAGPMRLAAQRPKTWSCERGIVQARSRSAMLEDSMQMVRDNTVVAARGRSGAASRAPSEERVAVQPDRRVVEAARHLRSLPARAGSRLDGYGAPLPARARREGTAPRSRPGGAIAEVEAERDAAARIPIGPAGCWPRNAQPDEVVGEPIESSWANSAQGIGREARAPRPSRWRGAGCVSPTARQVVREATARPRAMITAARKLLIALWRLAETGLVADRRPARLSPISTGPGGARARAERRRYSEGSERCPRRTRDRAYAAPEPDKRRVRATHARPMRADQANPPNHTANKTGQIQCPPKQTS